MENVTTIFDNYREHARHLRNSAFSTLHNRNWDITHDFDAVDEVLFDRLVLNRISTLPYEMALNWKSNDAFLIEPSGGGFRVMISSAPGRTGSWDYPIEILMKGDAKIAFQCFFDWDELGLIDFRYAYGIIRESTRFPEIIGHHVLIPMDNVWIFANSNFPRVEIGDNQSIY